MYKVLIFDLDGTAIPNEHGGIPTEHLIEVLRRLKGKLKVCAATGRPLYNARTIIKKLKLTDPCIISGGTQIIDPITEKILWERVMSKNQVLEIINIGKDFDIPNVWLSDQEESCSAKDVKVTSSENIIFFEQVSPDIAKKVIKQLRQVKDVIAHEVISWKKGCIDIHITHSEATKKHALDILLKMFGADKSEVIAAGDSNNDLPLFELANLKIAMSNGSDELKGKADIVAPKAEDDGLAKALENLKIW